MDRAPLDFAVRFESLDGSGETFSPNDPDPTRVPVVESFATQLNVGFSGASCSFARPRDIRFPTPRELQTMKIIGAGDLLANETRLLPISEDFGSAQVTGVGWIKALTDNSSFPMIYKDVDISHWGAIGSLRKAYLASLSYWCADPDVAGVSVRTALTQPPWTAAGIPIAEAIYVAPPGAFIDKVTGSWVRGQIAMHSNPTYNWAAYLAPTEYFSGPDTSGDLRAAGPGTFQVTAGGPDRRFALLGLGYGGTYNAGDTDDRSITWTPAVWGPHGYTTITPTNVVRYALAAGAPLLKTLPGSIGENDFDIGHLYFDEQATAETHVQKANAFCLWHIAVWGDRTFYFSEPTPLSDWDYMMPRSAKFTPENQGNDDDLTANGCWVIYDDVATGRRERIGPKGTKSGMDPAGSDLLRIDDDNNACNREGIQAYPTFSFSQPATQADALRVGELWLAARNIPKRGGQLTVKGYVYDRTGAEVPAWQVKAGARIRHPWDSIVRRVQSTSYRTRERELQVTYDVPANSIGGYFERLGMAREVKGLS